MDAKSRGDSIQLELVLPVKALARVFGIATNILKKSTTSSCKLSLPQHTARISLFQPKRCKVNHPVRKKLQLNQRAPPLKLIPMHHASSDGNAQTSTDATELSGVSVEMWKIQLTLCHLLEAIQENQLRKMTHLVEPQKCTQLKCMFSRVW
jgi:hypothetical protein